MRYYYFIILFISIVIYISNNSALYADEYGERFYNKTPNGMADFTVVPHEIPNIAMDNIATQMQNIMPAAGNEDTDNNIIIKNNIPNINNKISNKNDQ